MDILEELKSVVSSLDREDIDYAVCGGLAMAIYDLPRATLDIDLLKVFQTQRNGPERYQTSPEHR